jgi:hypothetical protein
MNREMTELSCFANRSLALPIEALAKLEAKAGGLAVFNFFNHFKPSSTPFNPLQLLQP